MGNELSQIIQQSWDQSSCFHACVLYLLGHSGPPLDFPFVRLSCIKSMYITEPFGPYIGNIIGFLLSDLKIALKG